jgi:hypothetical protein
MNFQIFVGIDQTGAVKSDGRPKPLNICIIDFRSKNFKIFTQLKIEKLCYEEINFVIKSCIPRFQQQKVLICIDSVFGLPQNLSVPFSKVLADSKKFSFENKDYGAITANAFFNQFLKSDLIKPQRAVEKIVKANSVFNLKPFQKNIGCGSYRIIKELSEDRKWFSMWPFEKPIQQFVICEGYPSFFWKQFFNLKTRNLIALKSKMKTLNVSSIDQADSFMLAYGAMKSVDFLNAFKIDPNLKNEGWILGVPQ